MLRIENGERGCPGIPVVVFFAVMGKRPPREFRGSLLADF